MTAKCIVDSGFYTLKKKQFDRENSEETAETVPDYYVVTDELDLHGFFPEQIPEMIEDFLANAKKLGLKRVRIVHGKGKSKLKYIVHKNLTLHPLVTKFSDAPPEAGGWGATIVLLDY